MTRRGFIGLVAAAAGSSALPTMGWLDDQPAAVVPSIPSVMLRHFCAQAGERGGRIFVLLGPDTFIDMVVQPLNRADWFGNVLVGPEDRLRVEIEGDITWSADTAATT